MGKLLKNKKKMLRQHQGRQTSECALQSRARYLAMGYTQEYSDDEGTGCNKKHETQRHLKITADLKFHELV
jgi:hypothetical protein